MCGRAAIDQAAAGISRATTIDGVALDGGSGITLTIRQLDVKPEGGADHFGASLARLVASHFRRVLERLTLSEDARRAHPLKDLCLESHPS